MYLSACFAGGFFFFSFFVSQNKAASFFAFVFQQD